MRRPLIPCLMPLCSGALLLVMASSASALTLREAVLAAQQSDPAAQAAEAQLRADQEASVQVLATRRPSVAAAAEWSQTDRDVTKTPFGTGYQDNYPQWQANVELRQPIFRFDWFARGEQADAYARLAQANYAAATQALVVQVAERYVAVLQRRDDLHSARAEAEAKARTLAEAQERLAVGAVAGTEVKEAQARWDLAQALSLAAEQAVADAEDALRQSTGVAAEGLSQLSPEQPLPQLPERSADAWLMLAREHNPLLQQAQQQSQIAQAETTRQQSNALPSLDLLAGYTQQDSSEATFGTAASNTAVGVQLQVPLFSGGALRSRIRQARAQAEAAEARLAQLQGDMEREVQRALRGYHTTRAQALAYQQAAISAGAAEQATRYGYEAGKRTLVDVLNAQSARLSAERERDRSRYDVLLAYVRLQQQVGVLSEADISLLDALLTQPEVSHE